MSREVLIVPTGTANTASVVAGLRRAGATARICTDPAAILGGDRVVLPGVGALSAAVEQLRRSDLFTALRQRVSAGQPTLAICLGLQLLAAGSEESPGVAGLGLLDAQATAFPDSVTVPQMGWNRIEPAAGCRFLQAGYAYFANTYRLTDVPDPWQPAWAEHGGAFVAGCEQGDVLACQFHPELSGAWGADLLQRWLAGTGGAPC